VFTGGSTEEQVDGGFPDKMSSVAVYSELKDPEDEDEQIGLGSLRRYFSNSLNSQSLKYIGLSLLAFLLCTTAVFEVTDCDSQFNRPVPFELNANNVFGEAGWSLDKGQIMYLGDQSTAKSCEVECAKKQNIPTYYTIKNKNTGRSLHEDGSGNRQVTGVDFHDDWCRLRLILEPRAKKGALGQLFRMQVIGSGHYLGEVDGVLAGGAPKNGKNDDDGYWHIGAHDARGVFAMEEESDGSYTIRAQHTDHVLSEDVDDDNALKGYSAANLYSKFVLEKHEAGDCQSFTYFELGEWAPSAASADSVLARSVHCLTCSDLLLSPPPLGWKLSGTVIHTYILYRTHGSSSEDVQWNVLRTLRRTLCSRGRGRCRQWPYGAQRVQVWREDRRCSGGRGRNDNTKVGVREC
jgi:hypothetical protein